MMLKKFLGHGPIIGLNTSLYILFPLLQTEHMEHQALFTLKENLRFKESYRR